MPKKILSPSDVEDLKQQGYVYDVGQEVDVEAPQAPPSSSFKAGYHSFASSALPAAGGGIGFGTGMALGAALAPETGGLSLAIPLIAGAIGGYGGSKAGSAVTDAILSNEEKQQLQQEQVSNPIASRVGGYVALPLGGMMPTPTSVARTLGGASKLAGYYGGKALGLGEAGASTMPILSAAEKAALQNSAAGAVMAPIQEAITAPLEGRDITAKGLAEQALMGAAFNAPTPYIGSRLGFHDYQPGRLSTPEGFRETFTPPAAVEAKSQEQVPAPKVRLTTSTLPQSRIADMIQQELPAPVVPAVESKPAAPKGRAVNPLQDTVIGEEILQKIRDKGATKPEAVQRIFPGLNFTIEQANDVLRRARPELGIDSRAYITAEVKKEFSALPPEAYSQRWNEILPHLEGLGLTPESIATLQKEVFEPKGLNLKVSTDLPEGKLGQFDPTKPAEVQVSPKAGAVIPAHEGFHEQWSKMTNEEKSRFTTASADELAKVNAERVKTGRLPYGPEEWFAMQGSVEFARKGLNTRNEGKFMGWINDAKAIFKQQFGKEPTTDELLRAHNYRLMNESRKAPVVGGDVGNEEKKFASPEEDPSAEYARLQSFLKSKDVPFQDKMEAFKRIEEIKNSFQGQNKGMPPDKESGSTANKLSQEVVNLKLPIAEAQDVQYYIGQGHTLNDAIEMALISSGRDASPVKPQMLNSKIDINKPKFASEEENPSRPGQRTIEEQYKEAEARGKGEEFIQARAAKRQYFSKAMAARLEPEDANLSIQELTDKYGLSKRAMYDRIQNNVPLGATVKKGRKESTAALVPAVADETSTSKDYLAQQEAESAGKQGIQTQERRIPLSETKDLHIVREGKLTDNAKKQAEIVIDDSIKKTLGLSGFGDKLPEGVARKAIHAAVLAEIEDSGLDPYTSKYIQGTNLPRTLVGEPDFRGTVMRRAGKYAKDALRNIEPPQGHSVETSASLDAPIGEEGGATLHDVLGDDGIPSEYLSDSPPNLAPEEMGGVDLPTRAKQAREAFIEPPSSKDIREMTVKEVEAHNKRIAETYKNVEHLTPKEKQQRIRVEKLIDLDSVRPHDLFNVVDGAIDRKTEELNALKKGISYPDFMQRFVNSKKGRTSRADPLQSHYEYEHGSGYGGKEQLNKLNPRQRLQNTVESDLQALRELRFKLTMTTAEKTTVKASEIGDRGNAYKPFEYKKEARHIPETPEARITAKGSGKSYGELPEKPIEENLPKEQIRMFNPATKGQAVASSFAEMKRLEGKGYHYQWEKTAKIGEKGETKFASQEEDPSSSHSRNSFFKPFEASFDSVRTLNPVVGKGLDRWEARRDSHLGLRNAALKDLSKYSQQDRDRISEIHDKAFRAGKTKLDTTLTGKDKEISELYQKYYGKIADIRREEGLTINSREAGKNPYYMPHQLNGAAIDLLVNRPNSPEGLAARREWAEHIASNSDGKVTIEEARDYVKNYIEAVGGSKDNYLSVNFGAIRKAEGYGLPDSLKEKDAFKALEKYGRRAAADLALFQELENKPEIAGPLQLKNPFTQQTPRVADKDNLSTTKEAKQAMKRITGDISGSSFAIDNPRINSLVRLINNGITGTASGLRDTATVPVNMVPYLHKWSDLSAVWRGITDIKKNSRRALETAAKQPSMDMIQFNELMDAPDRVTAFLRKGASLLRKYQGREAIENFNRDLTFSIGKELARDNVLGAAAGDKQSINWLKKFDTLIDGDVTKMKGKEFEAALDQMAKNFTDRNQGSYGGRGLPTWVDDSQFSPFFSMQKWSIEKSNVIYKDVVKPFITGENRLPALTYSLGLILTGAAIQQLNSLLSGRKSQDPEVKEVLEAGRPADYVAQLATLMQLGSFAGIVGDIMKAGTDIGVYGKTPRNVVSFPTATAAIDLQEKLTDVAEAMRSGENPWDVFTKFSLDMMTHNVQMARMVANRTANADDIERSDKFRDVRVYNQLHGDKATDSIKTNPYLGMDAREYKRTSNIGEAGKMLPSLIENQLQKSDGDYEKLSAGMRGLASNNYQTFPSMEQRPLAFTKYYDFLVRTQGKEEADKRLGDYMQQQVANQVKSAMVPRF